MQKHEIDRLIKKAESIGDYELLYYVKKLVRERNYLNDLVNKDTLTGLNNRRILGEIKDYSAAIMCDIDDYKQVNDIYGHPVGDTIIKGVSRILKLNIKDKDYICRYGGDEFLIILVDCPESKVYERVETMRRLVNSNLVLINGERISMSFGIAINEDNESLEELIKKADIALYESKEKGKNQATKYKKKEFTGK